MQITTLSNMGTNAAVSSVAQQEVSLEKRPPLPIEKKAPAKEAEVPLPGGGKPQAQGLTQTTAELERVSMAFDRRLKFEIDHESKEILVKVIDNETDKVIKVIPPEELQRLHSRIRETFGFLFDRVI